MTKINAILLTVILLLALLGSCTAPSVVTVCK